MVGELLKHKPDILDLIFENGHEIAFHTMKHSNLNELTKENFMEELDKFTAANPNMTDAQKSNAEALRKDIEFLDQSIELLNSKIITLIQLINSNGSDKTRNALRSIFANVESSLFNQQIKLINDHLNKS